MQISAAVIACSVSWCVAKASAGQTACSVHAKWPALDGESEADWQRRAPVRARNAAREAAVMAAIEGGMVTTKAIADRTGESSSITRVAIRGLMRKEQITRTGKGRAIKYALGAAVAA